MGSRVLIRTGLILLYEIILIALVVALATSLDWTNVPQIVAILLMVLAGILVLLPIVLSFFPRTPPE